MFIYLHGFNSGGTSSKASQLRRMFAPIPVLAPTYPAHSARAAVEFLRGYIQTAVRQHPGENRLVLVGSSLGGFYARHLAHEFTAHLVLINPSIYPDETLLRCVGTNRNEATGEEYELSAAAVRALAEFRAPSCDPRIPTLLLLDAGDELLDYRVAEVWYRGCGKTLVYADGSHRFDHLEEAGTEIRRLHDA
jgi:uncharacterized protein